MKRSPPTTYLLLLSTLASGNSFLVCECRSVGIVIPIEYELGDTSDHQPELVFCYDDTSRWHIGLPKKEHAEV